ncbi:alpha/beta hydrolase [Candidatus Saccharibacteria bacterium]|nr:alpha/beta hydrolase [Candidatus Saccharibacteria bacterium]
MAELIVNDRLLGLKDVKIHINDSRSDGRPVVLIHGWPLSGESWKLQTSALQRAGFRTITYDRRGFGDSDKPKTGYDYDTLAEDLHGLLKELDLNNVTLVGFSMGGGEVARYIAKYGEERIHSVVFAAAIPPMMMNLPNNPEGPLEKSKAAEMTAQLTADSDAFFDQFTKEFFSANADGNILVSENERQAAISLCKKADKVAALEAMQSFGISDFRDDLQKITVPTLVIHGDADGIVPFEGSGARTHQAITHSELRLLAGGPHGINVSHTDEFNDALISFLKK